VLIEQQSRLYSWPRKEKLGDKLTNQPLNQLWIKKLYMLGKRNAGEGQVNNIHVLSENEERFSGNSSTTTFFSSYGLCYCCHGNCQLPWCWWCVI
jgi:hypothetical protein